jgi:hypothetical protein
MKFYKLLSDAKFTGNPSKLTEDDGRRMAKANELFEPEVDAVLRGLRESQKQE